MEIKLPGAALEPLFGRLEEKRRWHCLESGLSRLRGSAKAYGVALLSSREGCVVTVRARDAEALDRFRRHLAAQTGAVQRGIARALEKTENPAKLAEFTRKQIETESLPRGPFRRVPALGTLLGSVFVDPPFEMAAKSADKALEAIAGFSGPVIVVGPSAIGKTTLLREAFKRAAQGRPERRPVFLSARGVRFRDDGGVDWREALGADAATAEALAAHFHEGRLALFLDGLDENLALLEADGRGASFWAAAVKNRLVMSCRDREYVKRFESSGLEKRLRGGLGVLRLGAWTAEHARVLYARLGRADRRLAALGAMPAEALGRRLAGLTLSGFSAWAYAVFTASQEGGRFPRNEYEILDYVLDQMILWESERGLFLDRDIVKGILMRAARGNFLRPGQGRVGRVPAKDLWALVDRDYPEQSGRKEELGRALRQLPFVSYDGVEVVFTVERSFAVFLAAKNFIRLALSGEPEELVGELRRPIDESIWLKVIEGLVLLGEESQRRFLDACAGAYERCLKEWRAEPAAWAQQDFTDILTPLWTLPQESAREFVRRACRGAPETSRIAAAAGFACAGDLDALAEYARELDASAKARKILRAYYLYWLGDGRPGSHRDVFGTLEAPSWEKTARWLSKRIASPMDWSLSPIYVYVFCDLAKTMGSPPMPPAELKAAVLPLQRLSRRWPVRFQASVQEFSRLAGQ